MNTTTVRRISSTKYVIGLRVLSTVVLFATVSGFITTLLRSVESVELVLPLAAAGALGSLLLWVLTLGYVAHVYDATDALLVGSRRARVPFADVVDVEYRVPRGRGGVAHVRVRARGVKHGGFSYIPRDGGPVLTASRAVEPVSVRDLRRQISSIAAHLHARSGSGRLAGGPHDGEIRILQFPIPESITTELGATYRNDGPDGGSTGPLNSWQFVFSNTVSAEPAPD